jgi:hypothetical protein
MKGENAKYIKHEADEFNDNPLIEAIRTAMDPKDFVRELLHKPEFGENVQVMSGFSRELKVALIENTYFPMPKLYTKYKCILKNILKGYIHRNPLKRDTKYFQNQVATNAKFELPVGVNLSACISEIGFSGGGKTLGIDKCLSLIPQVIRHNGFEDQYLKLDQITYLKFEAPNTKTQKGFVLSLFFAVDEVIGTDYFNEWKHSKDSVQVLLIEAKKIAYNHFIGVVFIDEIQRCVSTKDTVAYADKTTLEFIDNFFNSIGIPLIVAGTNKVFPLYRTAMSTARRLTKGRMFSLEGIEGTTVDPNDSNQEIESPIWKKYVGMHHQPNLLAKPFEFDEVIRSKLHHYSAGIPALFVRLIMLIYEEAIMCDLETINSDLIDSVYYDQFEIMHPALEALRDENDTTNSNYEDLIRFNGFIKEDPHPVDVLIEQNEKAVNKKRKNEEEDGDFVEIEPLAQTFQPNHDLRQLFGSDQDRLAKTFGKKL